MVDFHIVFCALLFGLRGLKPQIEGQFGCLVCVLITMDVSIDIGMHDNYQKLYVCYMFTS